MIANLHVNLGVLSFENRFKFCLKNRILFNEVPALDLWGYSSHKLMIQNCFKGLGKLGIYLNA